MGSVPGVRRGMFAIALVGLAFGRPAAQATAPLALLERYAAGEFEAVVAELEATDDFGDLLKELRQRGQAWIDAAPEADRPRRELAAATFALEAARAGEWKQWKLVQGHDPIAGPESLTPEDSLYWKPPPQLIEWGCALLRRTPTPRPIERWWQLAALAVAERAEDFEFLIGSPFEARGNPAKDQPLHLVHASKRFPQERRFALAQGIALDWRTWPERPRGAKPNADGTREAEQVFASLQKDHAVGTEATVRLGVLRLRAGDIDAALELFDKVEDASRDPFIVYLARYFSGRALQQKTRTAEAIGAYRGALAAMPRAQSASMALSSLLFVGGARAEAAAVAEAALTASPPPLDPWRGYADADDRFWPQLVARLRAEIDPRSVRPREVRLKPDTTPDQEVRLKPEATGPVTSSGQVFRSSADLVTVDVLVRSGGTPVAGLRPSDFMLLDNGVPQRIDSLEMEAVPVDITILVDTGADLVDYIGSVNSQLEKIVALARPDDNLRVIALDTYLREVLPLQPARLQRALPRLDAQGLASVNDGLAAALVLARNPDRRHLVVALTDGVDEISAVAEPALREIARLSNATLHIAQITAALDGGSPPIWKTSREQFLGYRCAYTRRCTATERFWRPYHEPMPKLDRFSGLKEAAALTGGRLHEPGIFTDRTASAVFRNVYEDYRRAYVLRYVPTGVKREGFHEITVRLPGHPSYTVNARRGYSVEAPPADPASRTASGRTRPVATSRAAAAGVESLVEAYGRNDFNAAQAIIRATTDRARLIREFRAAGNLWAGTPRREAVLALELAEAAFGAHRDDARDAARDLLTAHARLVRPPFEPDQFEREWLTAALAILAGAIRPAVAEPFVTNALERFPDEPRFLLARAIVADQRWPLGTVSDLGGAPGPRIDEVIAHYDAALKHPETAAEAAVRKSWFLHRLGRDQEALAILDAAGDNDVSLGYLRQLFRGHVLDTLGRLDAAIDAYRQAVSIVPAQSAQVALMNGLQRRGHTADARALAETIQSGTSAPVDPWWMYWWGDYRMFPTLLGALREQVQ